MLIYQAVCITHDPEIENSGADEETLGLFSELEYAQNAFDRQEERMRGNKITSDFYISKHTCFRGEHEVREYKLDAWREGLQAYWLFKDNSWVGDRIRK